MASGQPPISGRERRKWEEAKKIAEHYLGILSGLFCQIDKLMELYDTEYNRFIISNLCDNIIKNCEQCEEIYEGFGFVLNNRVGSSIKFFQIEINTHHKGENAIHRYNKAKEELQYCKDFLRDLSLSQQKKAHQVRYNKYKIRIRHRLERDHRQYGIEEGDVFRGGIKALWNYRRIDFDRKHYVPKNMRLLDELINIANTSNKYNSFLPHLHKARKVLKKNGTEEDFIRWIGIIKEMLIQMYGIFR